MKVRIHVIDKSNAVVCKAGYGPTKNACDADKEKFCVDFGATVA